MNFQFNGAPKLFGRTKIYTDAAEITADNIIDEVNRALVYHQANLLEEEYLYWYRRGDQPILYRTKEIRPEICNKVVINNADQVVSFKNGYFMTKPAAYVSRRDDDSTTEVVRLMNEYLYTSGKAAADNDAINFFHTCGVGVEYITPSDEYEEQPAKVFSLDPRSAFVVYSLNPGNRPVFGVNVVVSNNQYLLDVYTEREVFRLYGTNVKDPVTDERLDMRATAIRAVSRNQIGKIPIIEYLYNENRMSAFEAAIPIMDEINNIESNRADGVEQVVQPLIVTYNCRFDEGVTANSIRQYGMINLPSTGDGKADLKIVSEQLDQTSTQVTLDSLYEQLLDKTGLPSISRNEGGSSDNGSAVYLKSGYTIADTNARCTEDLFIKSNALFDEVFLKILEIKKGLKVRPGDYELKIERTTMSNILVKTQAAINLKQLGFSPALAFERSGLSNDPLADIEKSKSYIESAWSMNGDGDFTKSRTLDDEDQIEEVPSITVE